MGAGLGCRAGGHSMGAGHGAAREEAARQPALPSRKAPAGQQAGGLYQRRVSPPRAWIT